MAVSFSRMYDAVSTTTRQIVPIIEANRAEPIIPVKKPRKKTQRKVDLPDYDSMAKRLESVL